MHWTEPNSFHQMDRHKEYNMNPWYSYGDATLLSLNAIMNLEMSLEKISWSGGHAMDWTSDCVLFVTNEIQSNLGLGKTCWLCHNTRMHPSLRIENSIHQNKLHSSSE